MESTQKDSRLAQLRAERGTKLIVTIEDALNREHGTRAPDQKLVLNRLIAIVADTLYDTMTVLDDLHDELSLIREEIERLRELREQDQ